MMERARGTWVEVQVTISLPGRVTWYAMQVPPAALEEVVSTFQTQLDQACEAAVQASGAVVTDRGTLHTEA